MRPSVKSSSPDQSRASRKRERTRRAILAAARHLAAEHGPDRLTVAEIAEAADIGVGTFYYHFQTRDDVLAALMDDFLRTVSEQIEATRDTITRAVDRVKAGYLTFLTMSLEKRELFQVYFSSAAARADFAEAARLYFFEDTLELIKEGQAAGELRGGDPELLAHWVFGASQATLRELVRRADQFDPEAEATLLTQLFSDALAPPRTKENDA